MTDKQFRFARTSQCYCLGQRENACSKANCTHLFPTWTRFFLSGLIDFVQTRLGRDDGRENQRCPPC